MIKGVQIRELKPIPDDRGWLMEILRSDWPQFAGFGQVYLTTVYPGVVKAWHMHKAQTDNMACVKGMVRLGLWDPETKEVMEIFMGERRPLLVTIPPGVYHGFQAIGPETAFIINVPDKLYNYEDPDEHRRPWDDPEIPFIWEIRNR